MTMDALAIADDLHRRALLVICDLDIQSLVADRGEMIEIGSAAGNVMSHRDIDLGVLCPDFSTDRIFPIVQHLFEHPRVRRVQFNDERPPLQRMEGPEHEGVFCRIRYLESGNFELEWNIDLWFFPARVPRPELEMVRRLLAATPEERLAIFQIKHAMRVRGVYGHTIEGRHVYQAVLDRANLSVQDVLEQHLS